MPKTTKSTKRSTPAKKSRFKINFNSRKNQFLIIIVLVAFMGGGWFTYRTFAANNKRQSVIAAANLDRSSTTEARESTGKSGQKVARLTPGESIRWDLPSRAAFQGGRFRLCATVRVEASPDTRTRPSQIQLYGKDGTVKFSTTRSAFTSNVYTQECSTYFTGTDWGSELYIRNNGPSVVRVGILTLERL